MLVEVTQDDIDNGMRCSSVACPVSIAFLRRGCSMAHVTYEYINTSNDDFSVVYNVPTIVKEFIYRYDRNLPVQPFSFTIPDNLLLTS